MNHKKKDGNHNRTQGGEIRSRDKERNIHEKQGEKNRTQNEPKWKERIIRNADATTVKEERAHYFEDKYRSVQTYERTPPEEAKIPPKNRLKKWNRVVDRPRIQESVYEMYETNRRTEDQN